MQGGRFRLSAEIPDDATDDQVDDIRAGAFEVALRHAASDPQMRLEMLLGEARSALDAARLDILVRLAKQLEKSDPRILALAEKLPENEVDGLVKLAVEWVKSRSWRSQEAKSNVSSSES